MKTIHILRKTTQLLFLGLFIYMISRNRYPLNFPLPTDFFLCIDPLSALSVMLAGREIIIKFWPAIITIVSAALLGRLFCGWVCPLGTTIDISDRIIKPPYREKQGTKLHYIKYMLLILIAIGAIFSFQFVFFFDPLVIITRTTTLTLLPIIYYLTEGVISNLADAPIMGDFFFDIYLSLKGSVFPVQEQAFRQGLPVLFIFIGIIILEKISRRFWCRNLCPLGALLGLLAKFSRFGRWVGDKCIDCTLCSHECRMGTIKEDGSSSRAECILCLNCYFICPEGNIHFSFRKPEPGQSKLDITRRRFIAAAASGLALMGLYRTSLLNIDASEKAIRPPGAVPEAKFLDLCLRCSQCVSICSTTGACLQPAVSEAGLEGLWTPVAMMRQGYCEYNCTLCGEVCPSGAIKPLSLEVKRTTKMGLAFIDRDRCIPYYKEEDCLVCQEHCPTPDKAIKFKIIQIEKEGESRMLKLPYVDENLCIGCGICETKCPIVGKSGIFVTRANADRDGEDYSEIGGYY